MHTIIVISEIKEAGFQSAIPVVIKLYPLCYTKLKIVIHSCLKTIEWFCYFHSEKMKRIRNAREALQERMKKTSKTAWYQLTVWKFVDMFTQPIQTTRIYYLVRLTYRKAKCSDGNSFCTPSNTASSSKTFIDRQWLWPKPQANWDNRGLQVSSPTLKTFTCNYRKLYIIIFKQLFNW